jgi:hypothetical protein
MVGPVKYDDYLRTRLGDGGPETSMAASHCDWPVGGAQSRRQGSESREPSQVEPCLAMASHRQLRPRRRPFRIRTTSSHGHLSKRSSKRVQGLQAGCSHDPITAKSATADPIGEACKPDAATTRSRRSQLPRIPLESELTSKLIPEAPRFPAIHWLCEFAGNMMAAKKGMTSSEAMRCAVLAHRETWLLDPGEAADLWMAAITAAGTVRRLPRRLLG